MTHNKISELYKLVQKERDKRAKCSGCSNQIICGLESDCKIYYTNMNCKFYQKERMENKFASGKEMLENQKKFIETKYGEGKKYDESKLRYDLLEPFFEDSVAEVLTYGAKKYNSNNWQNVEPFNDRYYAALRRHLSDWRKGEKRDKESKLRHLAHCATNIYFLMWKEIQDEN